jgi:hypothetical protein
MAPGELRPVFERADAAVVFPGHESARARAAGGRIPVVDFDGVDPLALADRLAGVRGAADAAGGVEEAAPPTRRPDPAAVAALLADALR